MEMHYLFLHRSDEVGRMGYVIAAGKQTGVLVRNDVLIATQGFVILEFNKVEVVYKEGMRQEERGKVQYMKYSEYTLVLCKVIHMKRPSILIEMKI